MSKRIAWACGLIALLTACAAEPAGAAVLEVGPLRTLKLPSQAAMVAQAGDTIRIAAGIYTDCAIWRADRLTIEGDGTGAILNGKPCATKGIFFMTGSDITVRNLTFEHATDPDHNGAGILAHGVNLTVERSRFIGNENGILAGSIHGSTIRIVASEFRGNGKCDGACAHGVYAGEIDKLDIEHCHFLNQHVGHHIKSRALQTILIDNDIADGPAGNSSYLVDISNGGDLLMADNRLEKGPRSENLTTAVAIGFEGEKNPTHSLVIRNNSFTSDLPMLTTFVGNRTTTLAVLSGNQLHGRVTPLVGPGTVSP